MAEFVKMSARTVLLIVANARVSVCRLLTLRVAKTRIYLTRFSLIAAYQLGMLTVRIGTPILPIKSIICSVIPMCTVKVFALLLLEVRDATALLAPALPPPSPLPPVLSTGSLGISLCLTVPLILI